MEYSRESIDRMEKIEKLKKAWVIPYANNFRWKMDISKIIEKQDKIKEVDINTLTNGSITDASDYFH